MFQGGPMIVNTLKAVYPNRSKGELRSAAHACIGMALSVAHWSKEALRTPNLDELLHSMIRNALGALQAPES